ncbi:hypothetical protein BC833DRAFT_602024 [Globomyces pollinis-pini]|nr:hypothetical protein BC833DRAFT_602024 [Globomyces pollinis-pini]
MRVKRVTIANFICLIECTSCRPVFISVIDCIMLLIIKLLIGFICAFYIFSEW